MSQTQKVDEMKLPWTKKKESPEEKKIVELREKLKETNVIVDRFRKSFALDKLVHEVKDE